LDLKIPIHGHVKYNYPQLVLVTLFVIKSQRKPVMFFA